MHFLLAPARLAGSGRIPHWSLQPVRDVRAARGWHVSAGGLDAQSNKLRVDVIITRSPCTALKYNTIVPANKFTIFF